MITPRQCPAYLLAGMTRGRIYHLRGGSVASQAGVRVSCVVISGPVQHEIRWHNNSHPDRIGNVLPIEPCSSCSRMSRREERATGTDRWSKASRLSERPDMIRASSPPPTPPHYRRRHKVQTRWVALSPSVASVAEGVRSNPRRQHSRRLLNGPTRMGSLCRREPHIPIRLHWATCRQVSLFGRANSERAWHHPN